MHPVCSAQALLRKPKLLLVKWECEVRHCCQAIELFTHALEEGEAPAEEGGRPASGE